MEDETEYTIFDAPTYGRGILSSLGVRHGFPPEILQALQNISGRVPDHVVGKCRTEVNKIIFPWMETLSTPQPRLSEGALDTLASVMGDHRQAANERNQHEILNIERQIRDRFSSIDAYLKNLREIQMRISGAEEASPESVQRFIDEVTKDNWFKFDMDASLDARRFIFTTPSVTLTYKNAAAGIDMSVPMGSFKAFFNPSNVTISVHEHENNLDVREYYHPHIGAEGDICWGNAQQIYTRAMRDLKPAPAFRALRVILESYNDESPFRSLDQFDAEYKRRARARDGAPAPRAGQQTHYRRVGHAWIPTLAIPVTVSHEGSTVRLSSDVAGERLLPIFQQFYVSYDVPFERGRYFLRTRQGRYTLITDLGVMRDPDFVVYGAGEPTPDDIRQAARSLGRAIHPTNVLQRSTPRLEVIFDDPPYADAPEESEDGYTDDNEPL